MSLSVLLGLGGLTAPAGLAQLSGTNGPDASEVRVTKTFRGVPIPPERVRRMMRDLLILEERYELRLASAGVL
ncbi:MAG: hypothetical protein AAGB01_06770, partial [Cyanobacteria bacterium P01_F01_bin.42]